MNPKVPVPAKSRQSCPTLCDPRDNSPPGSPVPGILQARTLEWVAMQERQVSSTFLTPIARSLQSWERRVRPRLAGTGRQTGGWALNKALPHLTLGQQVAEWCGWMRIMSPHITSTGTVLVKVLVAQSCLTLCDTKNCSTPGIPVHHQLPEFTQTHVHQVADFRSSTQEKA